MHAQRPDVPAGLAALLEDLRAELDDHMAKEERVLFPMIRRGARGEAVSLPVRAMESEHDAHGRRLAELRALTRDRATPPHACATWRALYAGLARLEDELVQHIHLENNILFPRAARGE